jgi:hypothetical protein
MLELILGVVAGPKYTLVKLIQLFDRKGIEFIEDGLV